MLYELYSESPDHLKPIAETFKAHVLSLGSSLITKSESVKEQILANNDHSCNKEQ